MNYTSNLYVLHLKLLCGSFNVVCDMIWFIVSSVSNVYDYLVIGKQNLFAYLNILITIPKRLLIEKQSSQEKGEEICQSVQFERRRD